MRGIKIHAFAFAGNQGVESGRLQRTVGRGFARPVELVAFVFGAKVVCAENELELFKVDLVFAEDFGEQGFEF
ncbi:hypothetical protein [Neisseria chenwenguii]|nr:hypothetical protein [Neisseria chenwenguii]